MSEHKEAPTIEIIAKRGLKILVAEHKRICNNSDCNVSLLSIRIWLEKLGVKFTEEEERLFT